MAGLAVVLGVPVVGEFDHGASRRPALLPPWQPCVLGRGKEHQGVTVLLVDAAADLLQSQHVAVEVERGVEIADAQHGVQKSHDDTSLRIAGLFAVPTAGTLIQWQGRTECNDCVRSRDRHRPPAGLVEQPRVRRAVHRRRHLDRMRHPGLPLARRHLDQEPADPVRRVPGKPGHARRGLAAAFRHGGAIRRRASPAAAISRSRASTGPARSPAVITQNIDNLHQASGISAEHVVELHGNTTYATCLSCASATNCPG